MSSVRSSKQLLGQSGVQGFSTSGRIDQPLSGHSISLRKVLGSTTLSPAGFDCCSGGSCFALCAGSAAVVSCVGENLEISQKIFRTDARAQLSGSTKSFLDSPKHSVAPEVRNHNLGSSRSTRNGRLRSLSASSDQETSPSKANIRGKSRVVSCVALSEDGRLLAVGETGYTPRILIYSTECGKPAGPLACLHDHTFSVRCLAFSQDCRWLASIGGIHDNFVFLWAINPITGHAGLHSSNKCTSFVQDLAWMGNSIVSVGTRHVKVWRSEIADAPISPHKTKFRYGSPETRVPASPQNKTLFGRNCLLGSLIDATFTCITSVSDSKAILCTADGIVCLLDDTEHAQRLRELYRCSFGIRCVTFDTRTGILYFAGDGCEVQSLSADWSNIPRERPTEGWQALPGIIVHDPWPLKISAGVVAIGSTASHLITLDSSHISTFHQKPDDDLKPPSTTATKTLRAHGSSALGVEALPQPNDYESDFFTWSTDGTILFWSYHGFCTLVSRVPLMKANLDHNSNSNELRVVKAWSSCGFFVAGDMVGNLWLSMDTSWSDSHFTKAHFGEINDICIMDQGSEQIIASGGRDHTIQVFRKLSFYLVLLQTIDQHTSSVNKVLFAKQSGILLSSSTGRTIMIHKLVVAKDSMAFVPVRIVMLKAAPVSMATSAGDDKVLVVVTADQRIHKVNITSGQMFHNARLVDHDTNELILLNAFVTHNLRAAGEFIESVVGVSCTDKSIRIHSLESGASISKDFGCCGSISGIAILAPKADQDRVEHTLVTTAIDSTVMIWSFKHITTKNNGFGSSGTLSEKLPVSGQPLRHVLSRSKLSEYERSLGLEGQFHLPSTPSRKHPLSRLHKNPSTGSLGRSANITPMSLTHLEFGNSPPLQSTSPMVRKSHTAGRSMAMSGGGHRHRAKDAASLNDKDMSSDQLCHYLRVWRKRLSASPEIVKRDSVVELEQEMHLTLRAISLKTRRSQDTGEKAIIDLSDRSSDHLVQMAEEKVASEIANRMKDFGSVDSTTSVDEDVLSLDPLGLA